MSFEGWEARTLIWAPPMGCIVLVLEGTRARLTSCGVWVGLMRCPSKRKRTAPGWRDLREQKAVKICEEEGGRGVSARKYGGNEKK